MQVVTTTGLTVEKFLLIKQKAKNYRQLLKNYMIFKLIKIIIFFIGIKFIYGQLVKDKWNAPFNNSSSTNGHSR